MIHISYLLCQLYQMKVNSQTMPVQFGKWRVLNKIGEGSFGSIYSVQNTQSEIKNETNQYAIKTESIANVKQMLVLQYSIYKQFQGNNGFPKVIQYVEEQRFSYLVMEKFEASLDKFAASCFPKQFLPTDTLLQIMYQILNIIEKIHKKGYLYRDMKPANFMVRSPYQQVFIIDFGLCKKYIVNNRHIKIRENKKLVGTPIFCSRNTHAGLQQSRRDDIQSLIFTSLYFAMELPWQFVTSNKQLTKQAQYEQIYQIKRQINWQMLVKQHNKRIRQKQGLKNYNLIPNCIAKILAHVQGLRFQEEPNYKYISTLIKDEYLGLVGQQLSDSSINWKSKIKMSELNENKYKIIQQGPNINNISLNSGKQENKVRKINFKAPLKSKIINAQNQSIKKKQQLENPKI